MAAWFHQHELISDLSMHSINNLAADTKTFGAALVAKAPASKQPDASAL